MKKNLQAKQKNLTNFAKRTLSSAVIFSLLLTTTGFSNLKIAKAAGTMITVDTLDGTGAADGLCSLPEAVQAANTDTAVDSCMAGSGDDDISFDTTVLPPTGTIDLSAPLLITQNLVITGFGPNSYTVNANGQKHAFEIDSVSNDQTVTIDGLTVTGANSGGSLPGFGGGFYVNFGDTLNLNNMKVTGNIAVFGGGIFNSGNLNVANSDISNNSTTNGGPGGGIFTQNMTTITNSTISANTATGAGGGVYAVVALGSPAFSLTVRNSALSQNSATLGGGMLLSNNLSALIDSSTFDHNHATADGGALYAQLGANISTFVNNTVAYNTADMSAAGIYLTDSGTTANIVNSTIAHNNADANADDVGDIGGLFVTGGANADLMNTLLAGNFGATMPDCNTFNSNDFNLVEHSQNCTITGTTTRNILDQDPNLDANLTNNGGTTSTEILLAGSPAINAGTSAGAPAVDQRGTTRPQSAGVDIGAVEMVLASSTTVLSSSQNPGTANQAFTLTATVSGASGAPTGTVSFFEGATPVGAGPVTVDAGGLASVDPTDLSLGTHTYTAVYSGDNVYNGSTSAAFDQLMNPSGKPVLHEKTPVPAHTSNGTEPYTFTSDLAGTITYGGSCVSTNSVAVAGDNTITFDGLAVGTHSDCTVTVTTAAGMASDPLLVTAFDISPGGSGGAGGGGGGGVAVNPGAPAGAPATGGPGFVNAQGNPVSGGSTPVETANPGAPAGTPATGGPGDVDAYGNPINIFSDIQKHWAEDNIRKLAADCKVTGYKDASGKLLNLFKPDNNISRAELLTILIKCKFGDSVAAADKAPFKDVPTSNWAAVYIQKGVAEGIVKGYVDGTFKPDQTATRAEALKMIVRVWMTDSDLNAAKVSTSCTDVNQEMWYARYFNLALDKGIITGYLDTYGKPTGKCGPEGMVTRAESAKMIVKTKG